MDNSKTFSSLLPNCQLHRLTEENTKNTNLKLCECGECNELIPIIDKWYKRPRFKKGHQNRGKFNGRYMGGMKITPQGYLVKKRKDHPYCDDQGYYPEHRWVLEQHYSKKQGNPVFIKPEIDVHHINGDPLDNRIENLQLVTHGEHSRITNSKNLTGRVCKICGSEKTNKRKNGRPSWSTYEDGFICSVCYMRERKKDPGYKKKLQDYWKKRYRDSKNISQNHKPYI